MSEPPSDRRVVVTELINVFGGRARAVDQLSFTVEPGSVILDRGRVIRSGTIAELTAGTDTVIVRTPQGQQLADALTRQVLPWRVDQDVIRIRSDDPALVGHLAFTSGVEVHELRRAQFDLEQLFFALIRGQYAGTEPTAPRPDGGAA